MSTIETPDSLKMVREALCVAQAALPSHRGDVRAEMRASETIQRLIEDIDRQRPLGPDGKHGDRHTPACGCEDTYTLDLTVARGPEVQVGDPITITDLDGTVAYRGKIIDVRPDGGFALGAPEAKP